jgi:L-aminopeptidase/D-esterase-like protein
MLVTHVDAVVLTGGSAFGLATAGGVMGWLEERGRGYPTGAGPVPIVVALGLFDLMVGDASVRPGPAEGRAACEAATDGVVELGAVGAGTGATVGKVRGADHVRPGGLGSATVTATVTAGDLVVSALVAVNAFGEVDDGAQLAGAPPRTSPEATTPSGNSTTVHPVRATGSVQCPTRTPATSVINVPSLAPGSPASPIRRAYVPLLRLAAAQPAVGSA